MTPTSYLPMGLWSIWQRLTVKVSLMLCNSLLDIQVLWQSMVWLHILAQVWVLVAIGSPL